MPFPNDSKTSLSSDDSKALLPSKVVAIIANQYFMVSENVKRQQFMRYAPSLCEALFATAGEEHSLEPMTLDHAIKLLKSFAMGIKNDVLTISYMPESCYYGEYISFLDSKEVQRCINTGIRIDPTYFNRLWEQATRIAANKCDYNLCALRS